MSGVQLGFILLERLDQEVADWSQLMSGVQLDNVLLPLQYGHVADWSQLMSGKLFFWDRLLPIPFRFLTGQL